MIETISQIEDLYRYNDWANAKVFALCEGLTHAQLDEKREMGLGSLRNTLFHILTAEQIWLERWQVVPWRPFPTDSLGMDIDDIEAQLRQISQARLQMIKSEKSSRWQRIVNYKDAKGNEHSNPLEVLLHHVVNHSIYHRAQALAYLKSFGKSLPVGIDFLLYKLARPALDQEPASQEKFRAMGLDVAKSPGWNAAWDKPLMERYLAYDRWANAQLLTLLADASAADLDRDFGFGQGTIRKTLTHILNANGKWVAIFNGQAESFQPVEHIEIDQMSSNFDQLANSLSERVATLDGTTSQAIVTATPGGIPLKLRVSEALIQLWCHGTHHRAQLVNMLRHIGRPVPPSDLIAWWRQTNAPK